MNNFLVISISIIPIIIILLYVYIKDKREKEPIYLLSLLFIGGIIACIISIIIDYIFKKHIPFLNLQYSNMNVIQILFKSFFTIAIIEESSKWIINYLISWKNKNFNQIYDSIVYCVFTSLGFALIENIIYAMTLKSYGIMPIIMRDLISVPAHAAFGIFMGFYLGISKNAAIYNKHKKEKKYKICSIAIPIFLHLTYNLCLINTSKFVYYTFIIFLITIYISAYIKIIKLSNIHKMLNKNDTLK